MTDGAGPEYVTDVPYIRSFVGDLSPTRLRLVAALNGFPAPPSDGFDYCELGAAHGDTTATLAASYPRARFVGVDLNPAHIASANKLATAGQLKNVRFLECDFEQLQREELPDFDFIGAHGVLSWIGPLKRKAIIDFASAKLKPGGLLYVGYNALPGWAPIEPLRRLMLDRVTGLEENSLEHARLGLEFARLMSDSGAGYFVANPNAKAMLGTMERMGLSYVAHEYFHSHWVPMYFAQLAGEMAAGDLYFVGQLPLYLNYRDIAIPAALAAIFQRVADRITFESLKDFALNEFFRSDVYVKGKVGRTDAVTQQYLDATPFGRLVEDEPIAREVRLPHHTLRFDGKIFDALLPAVADGATTVTELACRPSLAPYGVERIRAAILHLALAGQISPMLADASIPARPQGELFRVPSAYNRAVLELRLSSESSLALASEVAGTGVSIPMLRAIAIRLFTEVEPEHRPAWLSTIFDRYPLRLQVRGHTIDDMEERERVLLGEVQQFRERTVPKLLALGILGRA